MTSNIAIIKKFWDLDAWKKAHNLVLTIYTITKGFPSTEKFGLTNQLQRTASSISANIAEGYDRYHFKDKQKFYYNARASAAEVQNFLILAKDLQYITESNARDILIQTIEVKKLINGLIRSIQKQLH